ACIRLMRGAGREHPVKTLEMARALLERTRFLSHPVRDAVLREIVEWLVEGPPIVAAAALDLLSGLEQGVLDPRLVEDLFERHRRRFPLMEEPQYLVAMLIIVVRAGHWPLATMLGERVLSGNQRLDTGRRRRRHRTDVDFQISPEVALALLQISREVRG